MSYAGKRVLVTGAGGFIGGHLVEALIGAGARVTALRHYHGRDAAGDGAAPGDPHGAAVTPVFGDIRDPLLMRQVTAGHDAVFHLAALISIPYSYAAPHAYVTTNVEGTLSVLQAAREANVPRVVHVSTSEVYGTAQYVPIDERHPLRTQSPYAASKLGGESLAMSYWTSFGLPVTIVRPFNTYGPRQSRRAVIPAILAQLAQRAPELRVGATAPRRDFTYVADTVRGLLALGSAPAAVGEVVNLGSGRDASIAEVIDLCCELAGHRPPIVSEAQRTRPARSEVLRLQCDAALAARLAGWQPRVGLREGLAATWASLAGDGAERGP